MAGDYRSAPRRPPQQPVYYYAQPQVVQPQIVYSAPPVYYQRYDNQWNGRDYGHHHRHEHGRHRGHDRGYDYRY
mgnify:CR=1 FL=1